MNSKDMYFRAISGAVIWIACDAVNELNKMLLFFELDVHGESYYGLSVRNPIGDRMKVGNSNL